MISVIIPAYNEEAVIEQSIGRVEKVMLEIGKPYEIVVVDDGSTDQTEAILTTMMKNNHPHLKVHWYDLPSRRENLARSIARLSGDYIIVLDMDLSMHPRYIHDFVHWLDKGYGMVIANRYHKDSVLRRNLKRLVISKAYNALIMTLFQTHIPDNICGFKAFRKEDALKLVEQAGTDETKRRSVFWDTQILIEALNSRISFRDIPVEWSEGEKTALNFKREAGMLPYIFTYWLKLGGLKYTIKRMW